MGQRLICVEEMWVLKRVFKICRPWNIFHTCTANMLPSLNRWLKKLKAKKTKKLDLWMIVIGHKRKNLHTRVYITDHIWVVPLAWQIMYHRHFNWQGKLPFCFSQYVTKYDKYIRINHYINTLFFFFIKLKFRLIFWLSSNSFLILKVL